MNKLFQIKLLCCIRTCIILTTIFGLTACIGNNSADTTQNSSKNDLQPSRSDSNQSISSLCDGSDTSGCILDTYTVYSDKSNNAVEISINDIPVPVYGLGPIFTSPQSNTYIANPFAVTSNNRLLFKMGDTGYVYSWDFSLEQNSGYTATSQNIGTITSPMLDDDFYINESNETNTIYVVTQNSDGIAQLMSTTDANSGDLSTWSSITMSAGSLTWTPVGTPYDPISLYDNGTQTEIYTFGKVSNSSTVSLICISIPHNGQAATSSICGGLPTNTIVTALTVSNGDLYALTNKGNLYSASIVDNATKFTLSQISNIGKDPSFNTCATNPNLNNVYIPSNVMIARPDTTVSALPGSPFGFNGIYLCGGSDASSSGNIVYSIYPQGGGGFSITPIPANDSTNITGIAADNIAGNLFAIGYQHQREDSIQVLEYITPDESSSTWAPYGNVPLTQLSSSYPFASISVSGGQVIAVMVDLEGDIFPYANSSVSPQEWYPVGGQFTLPDAYSQSQISVTNSISPDLPNALFATDGSNLWINQPDSQQINNIVALNNTFPLSGGDNQSDSIYAGTNVVAAFVDNGTTQPAGASDEDYFLPYNSVYSGNVQWNSQFKDGSYGILLGAYINSNKGSDIPFFVMSPSPNQIYNPQNESRPINIPNDSSNIVSLYADDIGQQLLVQTQNGLYSTTTPYTYPAAATWTFNLIESNLSESVPSTPGNIDLMPLYGISLDNDSVALDSKTIIASAYQENNEYFITLHGTTTKCIMSDSSNVLLSTAFLQYSSELEVLSVTIFIAIPGGAIVVANFTLDPSNPVDTVIINKNIKDVYFIYSDFMQAFPTTSAQVKMNMQKLADITWPKAMKTPISTTTAAPTPITLKMRTTQRYREF